MKTKFKVHALAAILFLAGSAAGQTLVTSPEQLRSVAAATPQEPVRARTYFVNNLPADALSRRVANWDLDVRGFTFQGKEMTGGYTLSKGESMDDALASSRQGQDFFIKSLREQGEDTLADDLEQAQSVIVAVDVQGTAAQLNSLVTSESDLRVSDPKVPPPPKDAPYAAQKEAERRAARLR